mgnify:CR=1 FL=1
MGALIAYSRVKKHHAKVKELECIKAQILSESISYVKLSDCVDHFANLPKKIVQRLKENGVIFEIISEVHMTLIL